MPATAESGQRVRAGVLLLLLALLFTMYASSFPGMRNSNEGSHYALVRAMAQGRLAIDGFEQYTRFVDYSKRDAHYYSDKPPAVSALALPLSDERSASQRCHDGIKLGLKAAIGSGQLRTHRGHPVTVIVRTSLAELDQAAHAVTDPAVWMPPAAPTGGYGVLPMRDLIRMATDAIHSLAVFDDHSDRPLYRGRQKRVASADQRIIH